MGLPTLRREWALAFLLTWFSLSHAYGQENAIGGSVRAKKGDYPIGDVTVTLAQNTAIHDNTREKDGVYVLLVPKSNKNIDLVYEHKNFLRATDQGIINEQAQNKRPIVFMRANDPQSVGALSDEELDDVVTRSKLMLILGAANNLPVLAKAGDDNLRDLQTAALTFREEA